MKAEFKVVRRMQRFSMELLKWAREDMHIFGEHEIAKERIRLCEEFGADHEVVCELENELIDRRLSRQWSAMGVL